MFAHRLKIGIMPKQVPLWKDSDKDGGFYGELHTKDPGTQYRLVAPQLNPCSRPDPTTTKEE